MRGSSRPRAARCGAVIVALGWVQGWVLTVGLAAATEIPVRLLTVPLADPASGEPRLAVFVEAPLESLLEAPPEGRAVGDIWLVAHDSAGSESASLVEPFELDPAAGPTPTPQGLRLRAGLELAPGDHRLEVRVSSAGGEASGSAFADVHVPAAGEIWVSPPLLAAPAGSWWTVGGDDAAVPALPFADAAFLPGAEPEVSIGRSFDVRVITQGLPSSGATLEVRLMTEDGLEVPAVVKLTALDDGRAVGQLLARLEVEAPDAVPGRYRLAVGVGGEARRAEVALRLAEDASAVDLASSAASGFSFDAVEPVGELERKELAARYREALRTFADGDERGAVEGLLALEKGYAASDRRADLSLLRKARRQVVGELERAPGGLFPVIFLHARLDRLYAEQGEVFLGAQNRAFVEELVGRWVKRDRSGHARELGGLLLAALGSSRQALEVDPDNELALLRVAIGEEKGGALDLAAEHLEQLLAAHPGHPHARVRLAVVLHRLGRVGEARSMLRAITRDPGDLPPWIAALAFQELGLLEYRAGAVGRAAEVLRRGVGATGAQALSLQLAYVLDRGQRRREAERVLDRLSLAETGRLESPRHRYNGPPASELDAGWRRIAREVEERTAALRETLAARPGGAR